MVVHLTNAVAKAMANAFTTALDAGTAGIIEIYSGTMPTDADTAIGSQTLLATLTFSASSFGAATDGNPGGLITAASITGATIVASGTATWARVKTQAGGATICDLDVGLSGTAIVLDSVSFLVSSTVSITSGTGTMPES